MLGILYLILSFFVGYNFLKGFVPGIFKISKEASLAGKTIKLSNWMVTLPASFLTGTLLVTWITYLITWAISRILPGIQRPLIYGDLITFVILVALVVLISFKRKADFKLFFKKIKKIDVPAVNDFVLSHKIELIFVLVCMVLWSFFMIRSFYIDKSNTMQMGVTVFSDFGGHIPMIRSFSEGSNFPTEYPHYGGSGADSITGNDIRYHFMFHFLAGNLEFLGLRIDWAFNIPSILGIVAFMMLLYAFAILVFGNRLTAILTAVFFFFRSSMAVFTFAAGLKLDSTQGTGILKYLLMFKQFLWEVGPNMTNIGKTAHEDWGFYAQKVFVNKRHYGFALGVALLVLIIVFPLFRRMISRLKKSRTKALDEIYRLNAVVTPTSEEGENTEKVNVVEAPQTPDSIKFKYWIKEFFLSKDAWMPGNMKRSIAAGLLLGLIGFWNGAVVISVLPVLFLMAIFSKNRLEYLNIAAMAVLLMFAQVFFFTGGASTDKISLTIGYLADFPGGTNTTAKAFLEQHEYMEFFKLLPDLGHNILLFYLQLLGFIPLLLLISIPFSKKGGRWLTFAFLSPLILATLCAFSSDIGANHVIVIFSVILVNIIIANVISKLFVSKSLAASAIIIGLCEVVFYISAGLFKFEGLFVPVNIIALVIIVLVFLGHLVFRRFNIGRILSVSVATILIIALTSSGIIDGFVFYNMDTYGKDHGPGRSYSMDDPVMKWVEDYTDPRDIFLINPDFLHVVLLAGRKVYNGGAYLVSTTGYDWDGRMWYVKNIYGATDAESLRSLAKESKINYIVVDNSNRESKDYKVNEGLIKSTFALAFEDPITQTAIYKVN